MTGKIRNMIPEINYKIHILEENYNEYCRNSEDGEGDGMSLREYVERESRNDPNFFNWLYGLGNDVPEPEVVSADMDNLLDMI